MKAFIRKLSIKERKGYINSIIYAIFSFFHILLTKTILYNSKISYLTLITLTGSLFIMMSFYRIFRSLKKYKSFQKKGNKIKFINGLNSFISYFFSIAGLDSTSLTNVVFIEHLFPFLLLLNQSIVKTENISIPQYACFFIYIFCFLFIFIPALYRDPGPGIALYLFSIIFKFSANKYSNNSKDTDVDILMLNIGFYNAFIGGILIVIMFDEINHVGKFMWFLIALNALTSYFMKIFFNKVLKSDNKEQKLMILNIIILLFVIPIDYFLFKQIFYYNYLVLLLFSVEIFFFYKQIKKVIKSENNS